MNNIPTESKDGVEIGEDTSEYYYPITKHLIGQPIPRTMVDPYIATPSYAVSDPATRINESRPIYIDDMGAFQRDMSLPVQTPEWRYGGAEATTMEGYSYPHPSASPTTSLVESYMPQQRDSTTTPMNYQPQPSIPPVLQHIQNQLPRNANDYFIDADTSLQTFNRDLPIWGYGIDEPRPVYDTPSVDASCTYVNTHTSEDQVYDPRYGGFGDERRWFLHSVTDNPRYDYDDVDSARQVQFISRNDIDHLPWAPTAGWAPTMRGLDSVYREADKAFIDQTTQHRIEMQERLTRTFRNRVGWQTREMPKHTLF